MSKLTFTKLYMGLLAFIICSTHSGRTPRTVLAQSDCSFTESTCNGAWYKDHGCVTYCGQTNGTGSGAVDKEILGRAIEKMSKNVTMFHISNYKDEVFQMTLRPDQFVTQLFLTRNNFTRLESIEGAIETIDITHYHKNISINPKAFAKVSKLKKLSVFLYNEFEIPGLDVTGTSSFQQFTVAGHTTTVGKPELHQSVRPEDVAIDIHGLQQYFVKARSSRRRHTILNKIICDCRLAWTMEYNWKSLQLRNCSEPAELEGKNEKTLKREDFRC